MEKLRDNFKIDANEEILNEMKKAYLNCQTAIKYCKELGIPDEKIDEYITKIYSFVADLNYCKHCPGIKDCRKDNPLLIAKVNYVDGIVENQLVPCKQVFNRVAFDKQFTIRDFPDEWTEKDINKDLDESGPRKKVIQKFVRFMKDKINDSIYIKGNLGTGKSFLAAMLCVAAAKKSLGPICFLNSSKRIKELNDLSFKKDQADFQKKMDTYCNVPILVLDDFGNEFKNDYIREAIVYQILYTRATKKLFTIITSDYSLDEIKILYAGNTQAGEIKTTQMIKYINLMCGDPIDVGDIPLY